MKRWIRKMDYVDRLKRLAAEAGLAERSNLQYGWVLR